ncbi:isoaspartyl dipeptidase with L-asparaginase activity [Modestobacter italicus]|uniref:Isoaspartyl dipeptidase with L-asparaginase activity n=1 Tax=Modestobacter italicus (strain DSM 44449 / CECT 9708 / BC 501) TaxID=2732864 RepID=I4F1B0_MODI5|nr:isoaspartyl peptidase/L-asparaginase [Modestobacter marinus]CCH89423.1 isoaspartyl dipeptidase with L-asparaginase activity [Modestobacter marinus]
MHLFHVPPSASGWALVLHGGAGGRVEELSLEESGSYAEGLTAAYLAGAAVLAAGGSALDAVCATVERLEDDPLFNAGRGAALTAEGTAELDACVMTGDGRAGAIAACRHARNPVHAARKVMEETPAVLLIAPSEERLTGWDLATVKPAYFLTPARQQQLRNVQDRVLEGSRHGTVGAVAIDVQGRLAAATSTGGMVNQSEGRVGDTPIVGAGTYARDGVGAISCTGEGEAFLQGVVAADVAARVRYLGVPMDAAIEATVAAELEPRSAMGGLIAVGADSSIVVGHNSPAMFAAYHDGDRLVTHT